MRSPLPSFTSLNHRCANVRDCSPATVSDDMTGRAPCGARSKRATQQTNRLASEGGRQPASFTRANSSSKSIHAQPRERHGSRLRREFALVEQAKPAERARQPRRERARVPPGKQTRRKKASASLRAPLRTSALNPPRSTGAQQQ
jgi:hypothetical protein